MGHVFVLNYKHLHYFWVTARAGSIASAAEQLGVSSQAVSAQIGLLEEEMACELLIRASRPMKLTETGNVVFGYAQDIFSIGEELEQVVAAPKCTRRKRLRVGIDASLSKTLVYWLLMPSLRRKAVGAYLSMLEGSLDGLREDLLNRRLDVVLAQGMISNEDGGLLRAYLLGESDVSFMAAPTIARLVRDRCFPDYLADVSLIVPPRNRLLRGEFDLWVKGHGVKPKICMECSDSCLIKLLARNGLGIVMVPSVAVGETRKMAGLVEIARTEELRERVFAYSLQGPRENEALYEIVTSARRDVFARTL